MDADYLHTDKQFQQIRSNKHRGNRKRDKPNQHLRTNKPFQIFKYQTIYKELRKKEAYNS